jgi:hypothetical protein
MPSATPSPIPVKSPVLEGDKVSFTWAQWLVGVLNAIKVTPGNSLPVTVATLPTPVAGMLIVVTDSTVNTWGSVITGGGAFTVGAFYNGTNWTVAAK